MVFHDVEEFKNLAFDVNQNSAVALRSHMISDVIIIEYIIAFVLHVKLSILYNYFQCLRCSIVTEQCNVTEQCYVTEHRNVSRLIMMQRKVIKQNL